MKKTLSISILIFLFTYNQAIYCQSKSGYAIYKKKILNKEKSNKIKDKGIREIIHKTNLKAEELNYKLTFKNTEANFEIIKPMEIDGDMVTKMAIIAGDGNGLRYVNTRSREVLYQKEAFRELFLISSSLDSIKWKLTNESKIIYNNTCYKATTTQTVIGSKKTTTNIIEAWYTPEIPINLGPIGYAGLPGLIIELNIGKYLRYYITELNTKPNKTITIKKPTKGKKLTAFEYQEFVKKIAGKSKEYLRN